jgi:hypothetical protein
VFRVVPGHAPRVFARGFTNIIDIAFDKRGRLYVLEIATNGLLNTPANELPVGRLVRVNKTAAARRWPARAWPLPAASCSAMAPPTSPTTASCPATDRS